MKKLLLISSLFLQFAGIANASDVRCYSEIYWAVKFAEPEADRNNRVESIITKDEIHYRVSYFSSGVLMCEKHRVIKMPTDSCKVPPRSEWAVDTMNGKTDGCI